MNYNPYLVFYRNDDIYKDKDLIGVFDNREAAELFVFKKVNNTGDEFRYEYASEEGESIFVAIDDNDEATGERYFVTRVYVGIELDNPHLTHWERNPPPKPAYANPALTEAAEDLVELLKLAQIMPGSRLEEKRKKIIAGLIKGNG